MHHSLSKEKIDLPSISILLLQSPLDKNILRPILRIFNFFLKPPPPALQRAGSLDFFSRPAQQSSRDERELLQITALLEASGISIR